MSSASLILTDRGLALCEPKAVGAQGSTKVLAASSLGGCLVFVSSGVVMVALAAIGRDMRLSPRSPAFSPCSRYSLSSRGPTSTSSRETDPFGVRNQRAGKAERKQ
ncbi:hypothetical protein AS156_28640 [Bradyrhizobium macuxiense]|uniref:Uncharacterized protein n=1 Tax=Bradyrhizobium macuxiense TaxID=1755647 RepID=A0A109K459_9BRAD|nr:hypothetical protein [Bradyrhizobium macuxiense]KWV60370.1 hypothetical protein AS156_28640 [Bradyrhizobium macuxiense]